MLGSRTHLPNTGFHPVSFSRLPVSLRLDGLMISPTKTFRIGRIRVVRFRPKSRSCGIMPIWQLPRGPAKLEKNRKFSFDSGPWHFGSAHLGQLVPNYNNIGSDSKIGILKFSTLEILQTSVGWSLVSSCSLDHCRALA